MKAIIYPDAQAAEAALASCTAAIGQPVPIYTGPGPFADPEPGLPYSYIIKHPGQDQWALVADDKVEDALGETAVELDETWFPVRSILDMPIS